jgi:hypothetical protein
MSRVEETLLLLGVLSMIVSSYFRIRLFSRFGSDPVISDLTRGTFATTLSDLLSVALFRARNKLPAESRVTIFWFVALHWVSAALLFLALASYGIRSYL